MLWQNNSNDNRLSLLTFLLKISSFSFSFPFFLLLGDGVSCILGWPPGTQHVAKDDLAFWLVIWLPPPECWDCRCVPLHPILSDARDRTKASCTLHKHFTNQAIFLNSPILPWAVLINEDKEIRKIKILPYPAYHSGRYWNTFFMHMQCMREKRGIAKTKVKAKLHHPWKKTQGINYLLHSWFKSSL